MKANKLVQQHGAYLATIENNESWVKTKARKLDIDNEMDIAWMLDDLMHHFGKVYDFAGASSNNIFWEATSTPIRLIYVPFNDNWVTVINPEYKKLTGQSVNSTERCGSIPGPTYTVKRKTHVVLSGYDLDGNTIELEYGSKRGKGPDCESWIIQHEMDHLDGILIKDKSIF